MTRDEYTPEQQRLVLAGSVRNNMVHGSIFTVWSGLELAYRDGMLCRSSVSNAQGQQSFAPICTREDIFTMNNDEIWVKILGGQG
jgi:hypothetical protein